MKLTAPDDLRIGDRITVLRGRKPDGWQGYGGPQPENYSNFKGIPLQVLGLDLPYLVCGIIQPQPPGTHIQKTIVDVREAELGRISQDYMVAVTGRVLPLHFQENKSANNEPDDPSGSCAFTIG